MMVAHRRLRALVALAAGAAVGAATLVGCSRDTVAGTGHTSAATRASPSAAVASTPSAGPSAPPAPVATSLEEAPAATTVPAPLPTPSSVPVIVTTSGWDSGAQQAWVAGYVSGPESGGTCTLTATSGTRSVTATQAARSDATTTTCGSVAIGRDRLAPGTWTARLGYSSAARTGTSATVTIEVP